MERLEQQIEDLQNKLMLAEEMLEIERSNPMGLAFDMLWDERLKFPKSTGYADDYFDLTYFV